MLRQHSENLWTLDPPAKFLGLNLEIRMTVVRLRDGGLWLHSTVPLTDADQRELEALAVRGPAQASGPGPVRFIVAPSKFHHLYARAAKERFPAAKLLGAPGLPEKRKRLVFDGVLGDTPDPGCAADLQQQSLAGMPWGNEVEFFHPASRTLIVTDFLFNVRKARGWWTWLYLTLSGKVGEPCQSRLFRSIIRDKAAYRASVERIAAWDFDRIILSHGEAVATGGKAAFGKALAWLR
jgi:hypothetical protein